MSSTVPVRSPILQESPTTIALSVRIEIPPSKFSNVFCAPRPIAKPPMPSPASAAVTLTSIELSATSPITRKIKTSSTRRVSESSDLSANLPRSVSCTAIPRKIQCVTRVIAQYAAIAITTIKKYR